MKKNIIFLFMTFFIPIFAQKKISKQLYIKQVHKKLSLEDAVQQALKHNPDLNSLDYATQAYKSGADTAIAGYYPTLTLTSNIEKENDQNALASTTALNLDQIVYSFAGPLQKYKQAKNLTAISKLDKVVQENLIRLQTEKAFLQAWLVQKQAKTIAALKKSATTVFKRQKHKNKLKQLDKCIWFKDLDDYSDALLTTELYKDTRQLAYKNLEFLMGESLSLVSTPNVDQTECTELFWQYKNPTLQALDTYYHRALTSRPEIPQATKRIAIENWNIKLAQGGRLPVITANAEVGSVVTPINEVAVFIPTPSPLIAPEPPSNSSSTRVGFWSVDLSLKWSLFDGMVTRYQEEQAHANKIKEILNQEGVVLGIKQEVHEKYLMLSQELKKRQVQKIRYLRERNEFKLKEQNFNVGRIGQSGLDEATTAWQTAKLALLESNVNVALAERNLMYACGYPESK